jgi:hypothetical protein
VTLRKHRPSSPSTPEQVQPPVELRGELAPSTAVCDTHFPSLLSAVAALPPPTWAPPPDAAEDGDAPNHHQDLQPKTSNIMPPENHSSLFDFLFSLG